MSNYNFSDVLNSSIAFSVDPSSADLLMFDSGYNAAELNLLQSGSDVRVQYGSNDVLLLGVTLSQLESGFFTFANGSLIELGTVGADSLVGSSGNDYINGGFGDDTLDGGNGNDLYIFTKGDGVDTINQYDSSLGHTDTIQFTDVVATDVTAINRVGDNLVISYGVTDQLILSNYFVGLDYQVQNIKFSDGVVWSQADVLAQIITNTPPSLISFIGPVSAGNEDTQITISFDNLKTQSDASDLDGTVDGFVIKSVSSGVLLIGTSLETAIAWNTTTNNTVDAIHLAFWTPSANANGTLPAFTVVALDNSGAESVTAIQASVAITPVNDLPSGGVVITGVTAQNQTLIANTTSLADVDGLGALSYQWLENNVAIGGATGSSLVLTQDQVGKAITVQVSYTDLLNSPESVISTPTAPIDNVNDLPSGEVVITGITAQNETLVADTTSLADLDGLGTLSYQWLADDVVITGAIDSSLVLTQDQVGKAITVQVSYTDLLNSPESVISTPTAPIDNVNDAPVLLAPVDITYADTIFDDTFVTVTDTLIATDLDNNVLTYDIIGNTINNGDNTVTLVSTYGSLTLNQLTGDYSFVANDAAIESLTADVSKSFTLTVSDGLLTDSKVLTLMINQQGITESNGNDTLIGDANNNKFDGLAGNDLISGLDGNDTLIGGAGNDTLDGGAGADSLVGGVGSDLYIVDNTGDVVTETSTLLAEIDVVNSSITYTLGANIEKLTLTGTDLINGTGNSLANTLTGNITANILDGGLGNDSINGGAGDDLIIGGAGNDSLSGSAGNDTLNGDDGNDTLDGGAGADTMVGGLGNDTYLVDNTGDIVTETSTIVTEIDTVSTVITYTLGDYVEKLILTGAAGINGFGNSLNNTITGNSAANLLNGGVGADTLIGGLGNDTYNVDNTGDVVSETSTLAVEIDQVNASVTYSLSANVENLTLIGASTINGTGNSLNNILIGNAAANILNGGVGADTMTGGAGNDTYVVDNTGDVVTETSTLLTEIDVVNSSITYTLGANIEKLTLTGTDLINGTGNSLANTLTGNITANILDGGLGNDSINGGAGDDLIIGGAGNDSLSGGLGSDVFWFTEAINAISNKDIITDFLSGTDKLQFNLSIVSAVGGVGQFVTDDQRFWSNATGVAHDASDRLIYNTSSGVLSYDSDGSGANGSIAIALLGTMTHPVLSATDLIVV